ncbi:MAG: hypothetical protein IKW54_02335 [Bacteroidales bacterium]|nr:hypothetical protein [Bacteroidales bacterium]
MRKNIKVTKQQHYDRRKAVENFVFRNYVFQNHKKKKIKRKHSQKIDGGDFLRRKTHRRPLFFFAIAPFSIAKYAVSA